MLEDHDLNDEKPATNSCIVARLGALDYALVDSRMRELQRLRIDDRIDDLLLLLEHPEVVTAGRRTGRDGVVLSDDYRLVEVDRGGGLTWHGPGQLVAYPVFKWSKPGERSVRGVIEKLEAWVIAALANLEIEAARDHRMHGVWVAGRKVASIGLSFQHWVTRHGLSINLSTPVGRVEGFAGCALEPGTTTSLLAVTGRSVSRPEMETALLATMVSTLGRHVGELRTELP